MTEVYFHCSDAENVFIARRGAGVELNEAFIHAERMVRTMVGFRCSWLKPLKQA